jgi:predicted permease
MSRLKGWTARLRSVLWRREAESRMAEEFRFHVDRATEQYVAEGMSPSVARRRAHLEFGGEDRFGERMRDGRGLRWLDDVVQDTRYALRGLSRAPGFTLVAVLTIGIGVGAVTTLSGLANALLFRDLPVPAPERLQIVQEQRDGIVSSGAEGMQIPFERYLEYEEATRDVFSGLAAHRFSGFSLTALGGTRSEPGTLTSGNYFRVLGIEPAAGRFYERDDEAAVVLSHALWHARFGGETSVLGSVVHIDGQLVTVVGVAPRGFSGTSVAFASAFWMPHRAYAMSSGVGQTESWVALVGRLRPGVDAAAAAAHVDGVAQRIPPGDAETEVRGAALERLRPVTAQFRAIVFGFMGMLLATALLVLFIASANIAALLVARAIARRRELAVRLAIGAGRARVVRQFLTETGVLFLGGAAAGVLLSLAGVRLIGSISLPLEAPLAIDATPDLRVLGVALAMTALTALVFGLVPAVQASRTEVQPELKEGGRTGTAGSTRGRSIFVTAQLAMSVVLLVVAGLFVRTLQQALAIEPGLDPRGVVVGSLSLGPHGFDQESGRAFQRELVERVAALPGVEAATLSRNALLSATRRSSNMLAAEDRTRQVDVTYNLVDADFFPAMRIPLAAGRAIDERDAFGGAPVVVINESLAARLWPGTNAVGHELVWGSTTYQVVGVARDGRYVTIVEAPEPYAFFPLAQSYSSSVALNVRSRLEPGATIAMVEQELRALHPFIALEYPAPLETYVRFGLFPNRFAATVIGGFGAVGLLLAALGLYGVLAYQVAQRTREFGVRIALGARPREIARLLLARAGAVVGAGLAIGLVLAAALTRFLEALLYGLSPIDPVTFTGVPLLLVAVALLAGWAPARRATRIAPIEALRE